MARRSALGRKATDKRLGERHLILCEGKTEAAVLTGLRQHWRLASARVEVVPELGEPKTLIERARKEKRAARGGEGVTTVHVVFDRDEHAHWASAVKQARDLGMHLGVSNPCFELWGLLLHQDQRASLTSAEAQKTLERVHGGYAHKKQDHRRPELDLSTVLAHLDEAEARARALRAQAAEREEYLPNPVTTFDQVVAAIRPRSG
ncbi:MAG: RloB domain-containing protein [Deltaproteobacteria bacterium]|nr:RloB domain-containing protein [Deltaproteobacteria bacterium]